jgi:tetratricopeptide (TPR) repeat protein
LAGAVLAAALALSACATPDPVRAPVAPPAAPVESPSPDASRAAADAASELAAGVALYEQGHYVDAIRSLSTAQEIWRAPAGLQVTAYKYLAFSHCLLKRPQPCRDSFRKLLAVKPDFELAAAEAGHPLWTEPFDQAKREAAARPAKIPLARTLP